MKKSLNTEEIATDLRANSPFFNAPKPQEPKPVTAPQVPPKAKQPIQETVPDPLPRHPTKPEQPVLPTSQNRTSERPSNRSTTRTVEQSNERRPVRRRARRYSFEIYEDQIDHIKRLALEDQLRGGDLNQSKIVRQALDRYLSEIGKATE